MGITDRSSSRNGARVIWIALHTSEGGGTARQLRDADWWVGSSHAICDNTELLTPAEGCVPYERGSWTLRNGNARSVNIEQIGYAKWTRDYWLTERMPQLRHTARWVADLAARFRIPLTYIGTQGVRDGRPGVIQHNDYSQGTGDGTHWDCGPGYPVDVVIDMARNGTQSEEFDMATGDEILAVLHGYGRRVEDIEKRLDGDLDSDVQGYGRRVENIEAQVAEILAILKPEQ